MPLTNSGLCYGRGQVLRRGGGRGGRGVGNNWIGRQGLERLAEGAPVVVSKGCLSDTNASSVMLPAKKGTCKWSSSMNNVLPKSLHVKS